MNYKKRIIEAVQKTNFFGLDLSESPLPFKPTISLENKKKIFQFCGEALEYHGYITSSDLANKCTEVHLMLQHYLKSNLNVEAFITVGDRYWDDYIYCEMTDASIKKELESPNIHESIKAHVWLTLCDGTILDCTAEAHADILFNRGEHPSHKCIMFIEPDGEENAKVGYHRPYLIGSSFLEKTGMYQVKYS
jgi:hypothetical protein